MNTLEKADLKELTLFESDLDITKAFDGTHLRHLVKQDKKQVLTNIILLTKRMNDHFNTKAKLNDNQIMTIAVDFLEVFKFETLEDVVLLYKYARQGKLTNKVYKLDAHTIFGEWLPKYLEIKSIERERRVEHEKNERFKLDKKKGKVMETAGNFLDWHKKQKAKRQSKKKHHDNYYEFIKRLPDTCKFLSDSMLSNQIQLAKARQLPEALEIYQNEQKRRANENK